MSRTCRAAPVAIVFGAGLWNGEPSPYLAHRLDAAAALYDRGTVRAVLVTGDNSRHDYDEPDAMRAYLLRHGVPAHKIVSDYAGFDTWDSCSRAHRIFGVDRAVLVSQGFHIRRALALCTAAGVDVIRRRGRREARCDLGVRRCPGDLRGREGGGGRAAAARSALPRAAREGGDGGAP